MIDNTEKLFGRSMTIISKTTRVELKENYQKLHYEDSLQYWLDKFNDNKSPDIMRFIKNEQWEYDELMGDYLIKLREGNERIVPTNG